MKGTPDLRLMARAGVPVGKLLAVRLEHGDTPQAWTWAEYASLILLLALYTGGFCWFTSAALAHFGW